MTERVDDLADAPAMLVATPADAVAPAFTA
jgi:hypothetical protein